MPRDALVEQGLCEGRLVTLVVTPAPVADQVDEEVAVEALPIPACQAHGGEAGGRIVGVDVQNGYLEPLGEVASIKGRARLVWLGGEANLVVGDEVDRAAGSVAGQPREVQCLGDDALAGKRRVAMNDDGPG